MTDSTAGSCLSGFEGRDGSPSRPFTRRAPHLIRLNGGLGEPALPNAPRILSCFRFPFEWFIGKAMGYVLPYHSVPPKTRGSVPSHTASKVLNRCHGSGY